MVSFDLSRLQLAEDAQNNYDTYHLVWKHLDALEDPRAKLLIQTYVDIFVHNICRKLQKKRYPCVNCSKPWQMKSCSRCGVVYCGRFCQKEHWSQHRIYCMAHAPCETKPTQSQQTNDNDEVIESCSLSDDESDEESNEKICEVVD